MRKFYIRAYGITKLDSKKKWRIFLENNCLIRSGILRANLRYSNTKERDKVKIITRSK